MKHRSEKWQTAYEAGGYRERYALEHGNKTEMFVHGHKCYKFTYSVNAEYQDANGAIYDTVDKRWVS